MPADLIEITLRSLWIAGLGTLLAAVPAVWFGWLFARRRFRGRTLLRTLLLLPMVLPPVAVGLVLLRAVGPRWPVGGWLASHGFDFVLSPRGAVLAAAVMGMPLVLLGVERGFAGVPRRVEQLAATLGAGRARIFCDVTLPLALPGILYGLVFGFARGLGEFGATVLVAGIVPGRTETLATAIYSAIERFDHGAAFVYAAVSVLLAAALVLLAERLLTRQP
ncbi:MAG: ABC transporter permease subunit [Planctomycetaceae bacterium]|nr:ABC transporter permease subunit [Planctomycetaceae bacterium]